MSILYMNPGFPQLFEDDGNYFHEESDNYNKSGVYCVPLDYENFHAICYCNGHNDIYFRFNLFLNLTNESWKGRKGFLRLTTQNREITLSIDDRTNLIISSGDIVMYRKPVFMGKMTAYELHVKSTDEETIELYINEQLAYTNKGKTWLYLNHEPLLTIDCKNIIYIPEGKPKRHGVALSSLILSDLRLKDATCTLLDYDIDTDYTKDQEYTAGTYMNLSPIIKNTDAIYAVEVACLQAHGEGLVEFAVEDNSLGTYTLTNGKRSFASEIMETYPKTKAFWTNNDPISIKAVSE